MPVPFAHAPATAIEPLQLLPVAVAGGAYLLRARALAARGRPVAAWRRASFAAGLLLLAAALASPLAHLGQELLLAHMAQHLLLADIAALLLVLGLTGPLLQPLLAIGWIDRLRGLGHPALALPLWAANLYAWHIPALYQGTLTSAPLHALEHGLFIGLGVAMWMPLAGPLPVPAWFGNGARLVYVIGVRLAGTLLANVLIWSGTVFYPDYAPGEAEWGVSALADQGTAGVIMMIEGSLLTIGLFAWIFLRAAREGEERQALLDLADARGLALDEARAARAVAAGRGARLRERMGHHHD